MALERQMTLDSGITISYHRVVMVCLVTNHSNIIEVKSYTSQAKRDDEKALLAEGEWSNAFTHTTAHSAPYDQTMTVEGAYEWLKANVSDFADSIDILE